MSKLKKSYVESICEIMEAASLNGDIVMIRAAVEHLVPKMDAVDTLVFREGIAKWIYSADGIREELISLLKPDPKHFMDVIKMDFNCTDDSFRLIAQGIGDFYSEAMAYLAAQLKDSELEVMAEENHYKTPVIDDDEKLKRIINRALLSGIRKNGDIGKILTLTERLNASWISSVLSKVLYHNLDIKTYREIQSASPFAGDLPRVKNGFLYNPELAMAFSDSPFNEVSREAMSRVPVLIHRDEIDTLGSARLYTFHDTYLRGKHPSHYTSYIRDQELISTTLDDIKEQSEGHRYVKWNMSIGWTESEYIEGKAHEFIRDNYLISEVASLEYKLNLQPFRSDYVLAVADVSELLSIPAVQAFDFSSRIAEAERFSSDFKPFHLAVEYMTIKNNEPPFLLDLSDQIETGFNISLIRGRRDNRVEEHILDYVGDDAEILSRLIDQHPDPFLWKTKSCKTRVSPVQMKTFQDKLGFDNRDFKATGVGIEEIKSLHSLGFKGSPESNPFTVEWRYMRSSMEKTMASYYLFKMGCSKPLNLESIIKSSSRRELDEEEKGFVLSHDPSLVFEMCKTKKQKEAIYTMAEGFDIKEWGDRSRYINLMDKSTKTKIMKDDLGL